MSMKAVFEKGSVTAQASGAWQYDAGLKLYMHGIPKDVTGTIEVQFAYAGDAKTGSQIAQWDAKEKAWVATVPAKYTQRSRAVNVYVYVTEGTETAKTLYTAVFTPKARPAPGEEVTEDEKSAWGELVGEVNVKLAEMGEAESRANDAARTVTEKLAELTVKEADWDARMEAAEKTAQEAGAAAEAASLSAAQAETAAGSAERLAANANTVAGSAMEAASSASETAESADNKATTASSKATAALTAAEKAQADAANALYAASGPITLNAGTTGWVSDSANDRYYQDFTANGVTEAMLPYATSQKVGGAFPLCGVETRAGAIRLYMSDVPTVSDTVTVYLLGVRA